MNYNDNGIIKTEIYDKINAEKKYEAMNNTTTYNEINEEEIKRKTRLKKSQIRKKKQKREDFIKRIAATIIIATSVYAGTKLGASIEDKNIARNAIEMEVDDVIDGLKQAESREEKYDIVNSFVEKNREIDSFQNDQYSRGHSEGYTIWKIRALGDFSSDTEKDAITDEVLDVLGYDSLDQLAKRNGFNVQYNDGKTTPGSYNEVIGTSQGYYKTEIEGKIEQLKGVSK